MSVKTRYIVALIAAIIVFIADQATKLWVEDALPLGGGFPVIDGFFNLVRVHNTGAVFGFLAGADAAWPRILFIVATVIAVVIIIALLRSKYAAHLPTTLALGLILGGAAGNLIDRVSMSRVVDFLDFHLGPYHWPAFNLADIGICVGAALLLIAMYRHPRKNL